MDETNIPERICSRCGSSKPLTSRHFARDRGGFTRNCIECKGKRLTFEQRFWSKVNKNGPVQAHVPHLGRCWEWTAGCAKSGYGELQRGRRGEGMATAHRAGYELQFGPIPEGMCVMHLCDNRRCVRHLAIGTLTDNNRDMQRKGRYAKTHRGAPRSLTTEKVVAIRELRAKGAKLSELAAQFGVRESTVSAIVHRKCWKHVA